MGTNVAIKDWKKTKQLASLSNVDLKTLNIGYVIVHEFTILLSVKNVVHSFNHSVFNQLEMVSFACCNFNSV